MLMRDQQRVDFLRIQSDSGQPLFGLTSTYPGVKQKANAASLNVDTITGAARLKDTDSDAGCALVKTSSGGDRQWG